jgi:hypothetical protein
MKKFIALGTVPLNETFCGDKADSLVTANVYLQMWLHKARNNYFGKPAGAGLELREIDEYFQVCVVYNPENEHEVNFAYSCSGNQFEEWDMISKIALRQSTDEAIKKVPRLKSYNIKQLISRR